MSRGSMGERSAENDAALIERVLAEHASEQTWKAGGWAGDTACACGWRMAMWSRKDFPAVHRKHVAEQIAARATPPEGPRSGLRDVAPEDEADEWGLRR